VVCAGAAVKDRIIFAGADHTFTSVGWEQEVIARTVEWFQQHLVPA
jgi:hypothetical protein